MSELMRRYEEARALLARCQKALCRSGWEDGEKDGEVLDAVMSFLGHEQLEDEHFGAYVPMVNEKYAIWSFQHNAWWAPLSRGYVHNLAHAGRYDREEARSICLGANYLKGPVIEEAMVPLTDDMSSQPQVSP